MKFSDEKITIKNGDNGRIEVTGDMARMEGCVQDLVALCNRKEEADG
ncbi:MAG: hypothetical protein M1609_07360 [Firmicutes bacterium]|nr:hypothetical protein [Bacillota bacterium]